MLVYLCPAISECSVQFAYLYIVWQDTNRLACYVLQLTDADQDLYKNFPLVISERWQNEVAETVFETINQEADKLEHKRKAKQKQRFDCDEKGLHCYIVCQLVVG